LNAMGLFREWTQTLETATGGERNQRGIAAGVNQVESSSTRKGRK
jgi:hypothetical protein